MTTRSGRMVSVTINWAWPAAYPVVEALMRQTVPRSSISGGVAIVKLAEIDPAGMVTVAGSVA